MRKWILRTAVICAGAALVFSACGQGEGKDTDQRMNILSEDEETPGGSGADQVQDEALATEASGSAETSGSGEIDGTAGANGDADASGKADATAEYVGLAELYEDNFPIGVALPNYVFNNIKQYEEVITANFNSITCENEMKPDSLFGQRSQSSGLGQYVSACGGSF